MKTIRVSPKNGDKEATLFSDGIPVKTVPAGTILSAYSKNTADKGGAYNIYGEPSSPNVIKGGCSRSAAIIARPYAYMYKDVYKHKIYGKLNNGTQVTILEYDDDGYGFCKVKGLTENGEFEGYVECRYIYAASISNSEVN